MSEANRRIAHMCGLASALIATGALLIILGGCAAGGASKLQVSAPTSTPDARLVAPADTPTATPDTTVCGAWSAANGATGQPVAATYGAISACALENGAWIITTQGLSGQPGVIGVDPCAGDARCLNGQTDRAIGAWTFYPAPYTGGVRLLGVASPGILLIDNGGHQLRFTIASGTYQA